jgi:prepilin-type N-terminal cleavage/methylation domain-containing protein
MKNRRKQSGFTLLELILAMLMAAMLSLALYTAMHSAIQARRTAQRAVQSTRAGSIAMEIICHDLENAFPPPTVDPNATSTPLTMADLVFSTLSRDELADAGPLSEGICTVEFYIKSDPSGAVLVRRITRNVLAPTQTPGTDELLCRNVRSFSVQYYDGTSWQPSWDSTQVGDVPPPAVSVTIVIEDPTAPLDSNGNHPQQRLTRVVSIACAKPADTTTQ